MKFYDQAENLVPVVSEGGERNIVIFLTGFPSGEIRNWRCNNCGKLLFQYESEVGAVMDGGDKPTMKPSLRVMCHRCRIIFWVVTS